MKKMEALIHLRIPEEVLEALDKIAEERMLSRSAVTRQILARHFGLIPELNQKSEPAASSNDLLIA